MRHYNQELVTKLQNSSESDYSLGYQVIHKKIPDTIGSGILDPRVLAREKNKELTPKMKESQKDEGIDIGKMRGGVGTENQSIVASDVVKKKDLIKIENHMINVNFYIPIDPVVNSPAVIFLHGGGFYGGDPDTFDNQCEFLAEKSSVPVISPSYRLSPENPYPAGLLDCFGIIDWVIKNSNALSINPYKLVVIGDSAGGNFAVNCGIRNRGQNIKLVMPIYGGLDFYANVDYKDFDMNDTDAFYIMNRLDKYKNLMPLAKKFYLQGNAKPNHPKVSPVYSDTISFLPKTIIFEAEFDYFRRSNDMLAEQCALNGVDVKVIRYQGLDHGYFDRIGFLPQVEDTIIEMAKEINRL